MTTKVFYPKPDTPEQIQFKISALEKSLPILKDSLDRMKKAMLQNHTLYSSNLIDQKMKMMEDTERTFKTKNNAIAHLKEKLSNFKTKLE